MVAVLVQLGDAFAARGARVSALRRTRQVGGEHSSATTNTRAIGKIIIQLLIRPKGRWPVLSSLSNSPSFSVSSSSMSALAFPKPILIIGAGISGLSLARTLLGHNLPLIVFDDAPASRRQGYGITLRSWAYTKFIDPLDISPDNFKNDTATDALLGGQGKLDTNLWDPYTGKVLVKSPPARPNAPESDFLRVNRLRLREFLRQGVDVKFEHKLTAFEAVEAA